MREDLRWRWGLIFVIGGVFAVGGFGQPAEAEQLVSSALLQRAGLVAVWDNELPLKRGERLERIFVVGGRVYALSSENYMFSLDKEQGKIVWARRVAPVGIPVGSFNLYKGELMSVLSNQLLELDPATGKELGGRVMKCGIRCAPARNSGFYYVGGRDGRLHVLRAEDMVEIFQVSAGDDAQVCSVLADDNFVLFSTDRGKLVSMTPHRPRQLWEFEAGGAIVGQIVRDGMSLYFASEDTNVYRLDIVAMPVRKLIWKHQVPGMPEEGPRVTAKTVYQRVRGKGLVAIEKASGRQMWVVPEGYELLAESPGRAYVLSDQRRLVVMDNTTRRRLYTVNFARVGRYAVDVEGAEMFVGDERGRVMCLRPKDAARGW